MRACREPLSQDFSVVCVNDNVSLSHEGFLFPLDGFFLS